MPGLRTYRCWLLRFYNRGRPCGARNPVTESCRAATPLAGHHFYENFCASRHEAQKTSRLRLTRAKSSPYAKLCSVNPLNAVRRAELGKLKKPCVGCFASILLGTRQTQHSNIHYPQRLCDRKTPIPALQSSTAAFPAEALPVTPPKCFWLEH